MSVDELNELRRENKKLISQVKVLEQELQQYTEDGPQVFKYELNRFINNGTAYIRKKSGNIDELASAEKGKEFERLMALIGHVKEAKDMVLAMNAQGILGRKSKDEEDNGVPFSESFAETKK